MNGFILDLIFTLVIFSQIISNTFSFYSYYVPDRGKSTSDDELRNLTEDLYALDTFEWDQYVSLHFQHRTYHKNITHYVLYEFPQKAEYPLVKVLDNSLYNHSTVRALLELFPHFNPNINQYEINSRRKRKLKRRFLNKVCATPVMKRLQKHLMKKGDLANDSMDLYQEFLSDMWFTPFKRYQRTQHMSSSGFEHTFLSEYSMNDSSIRIYGFHNWIYLHYLESINKSLSYCGFSRRRSVGNVESRQFQMANLYIEWMNTKRITGTMLMGISPELELAIYTACVLYRTNDPNGCRTSIGGSEVVIRAYEYYVKNERYISSVFPVFDFDPWNFSVTTVKKEKKSRPTEPMSMFMF